MDSFLYILLAIGLDLAVGDPRWLPHPVRAIGWLCEGSEKMMRALFTNLYLAGLMTVVVVLSTTGLIVFLLLQVVSSLSPVFGAVIVVILLSTTIATRDLLRHSKAVHRQLQPPVSLALARQAVARIVGRDTKDLTEPEVTKACVETVAENMVDGVTAPLFFAMIASFAASLIDLPPAHCSVIGAFLYKAVNTMDSMIGYKNEKYQLFGRVAAKLDDVANFLPARISGLCVIIAAFFLKLDYREAARIFLRDRLHHASPNSGHTEAATAGALGLRLGGPSSYFGRTVDKPFIGDGLRDPVPGDILKANRLMVTGSLIFIVLLAGLLYWGSV